MTMPKRNLHVAREPVPMIKPLSMSDYHTGEEGEALHFEAEETDIFNLASE